MCETGVECAVLASSEHVRSLQQCGGIMDEMISVFGDGVAAWNSVSLDAQTRCPNDCDAEAITVTGGGGCYCCVLCVHNPLDTFPSEFETFLFGKGRQCAEFNLPFQTGEEMLGVGVSTSSS